MVEHSKEQQRAAEASKEESNALKRAIKGFMNNLANDTSSFTQ